MGKGNIVLLHRQMARDALREAARRKAGRKPIGLSDAAIDYLTRANPTAWVPRTRRPGTDQAELVIQDAREKSHE